MDKPRICLVVTASDTEQAVGAIKRATGLGPDLIEVRLDYMKGAVELSRVNEATIIPLIATNRSMDQGGFWGGEEEDRVQLLMAACDAGFNYVDLELSTRSMDDVVDDIRGSGASLIVSYHDFEKTPGIKDLRRIMREEREAGADICKVVGTARSLADNLVYLRFLQENQGANLVCFGMGEAGRISRILSPLFGGVYTYASSGIGDESAPGQLTLTDMRTIYKILGV